MSSPSPEAPSTASAYRPLPEGPSPRWRRAAGGLRLVRIATWAQFAARAAAGLLSAMGLHFGAARTHLFSAASVGGLFALAASVALAVGLFRFGDAPPSVGVTEPARRTLAAHVGTLTTALPRLVVPALTTGRWGSPAAFGALMTAQQLMGFALTVAYLELLRRALSATVQALGGSWPTWTGGLVPLYAVWSIFAALSHLGVRMFAIGALSVGWALASLAIDAAFVLASTRLMRLAEDSLARQEATESALGG